MLKCYLKDRIFYIIAIILFSFVFSFISFLYGVPPYGASYSVFLCLFILFVLSLFDYFHYNTRRKQLLKIKESLNFADFNVIKAESCTQADYLEILCLLSQLLHESETKATQEKTEAEDFYALWVHQIKTPIAAMSMMLQQRGEDARTLKQELFKIEQYAGLVLSYQRLGDIASDLSFAKYSVSEISKQAVKKYAPAFIGKGVSVQLSPSLEAEALTDEKWLCFAIEQILSNAVKYTPRGGTVKLYVQGNVTFVVEDNGIGIAAEDLPRIFEKGFTGYNGRMDKKATGIGLYLTKKAIDSLGHAIEVTSSGGATKVLLHLSRQTLNIE